MNVEQPMLLETLADWREKVINSLQPARAFAEASFKQECFDNKWEIIRALALVRAVEDDIAGIGCVSIEERAHASWLLDKARSITSELEARAHD